MDILKTNLSYTVPEGYGMNYLKIEFNNDKPLLNAYKIVSTWYKNAEGYDYSKEPSLPKYTSKSIVLHIDVHNNVFGVFSILLYQIQK